MGLQTSNQNNSIYVRLLTASKDEETNKRCPFFQASRKEGNDYKSLGEFSKVDGFVTDIKIRKKEVFINNVATQKEIIQIALYDDGEDASYIVESSFNGVIKTIVSKLIGIDFETTKIVLCTYRNKQGYAAGTLLLASDGSNVPFSDEYHPKTIMDTIKEEKVPKEIKDDADMYSTHLRKKSDAFYKKLVEDLSELPKHKKPVSTTPLSSDHANPTDPVTSSDTDPDDLSFLDSNQDDDLPF